MTGPLELVGRDSELARVVACAETVVSSGLGVVVVSGEPGIGKSTLLAEVSRLLAERRWHTCEVVADELHRRTPYSALVEGARSLAGRIDNSWSERLRREAVSALDVFDAGQVDDGGAWFGRAEEAVARLVTSLAAVGPVAITVDDADLLDEDSVALLTVLLRRLSTAPVVLLLTARRHPLRPSLVLELMLDRLSAVAEVERVELEPWGSDDLAAGITPALGAAPDQDLTDEVHFRSDGNPLLAIEIARSLTEQRLVTVNAFDGTARLAAPVDDLQLSGRDMLLRRLAPLEPSVQAVARAAAVLRRLRVDELGLLARVTGLDEDTAAHAFDALVDAEVLCQVGGSAGSVFAFSHGLVADALYEATGPAERARLHRAAAQQLRDAQAAGLPVDLLQLADHLSASALPGDLSAAQTLTEAADLARTLAPARAAHLSERALELLPTGAPGRALVLSTHCRSLARASRPADAVVAGLAALAELAPGDTRAPERRPRW